MLSKAWKLHRHKMSTNSHQMLKWSSDRISVKMFLLRLLLTKILLQLSSVSGEKVTLTMTESPRLPNLVSPRYDLRSTALCVLNHFYHYFVYPFYDYFVYRFHDYFVYRFYDYFGYRFYDYFVYRFYDYFGYRFYDYFVYRFYDYFVYRFYDYFVYRFYHYFVYRFYDHS